MQNQFSRTQLLMGKAAIDTLAGSRVAIFGVGGVGGHVAEVLSRSGVGELDLFDDDRVCLTNVNRQIYALISTIGQYKVDVAEKRIHDINPRCIVNKWRMFYTVDNADEIDLSVYDYVVDCIDTVSAKIELIKRCHALGVPMICCMGAANKMDPTRFKVVDLEKTVMDPLAKVIRKKLRKTTDIRHVKCVFSDEIPMDEIPDDNISCRFHCICPNKDMRKCTDRRNIPASNAFVPAAEGLIAGGEVVKDLIRKAGTWRIMPEELGNNEAAKEAARRAKMHLEKYHKLKMEAKNEAHVISNPILS